MTTFDEEERAATPPAPSSIRPRFDRADAVTALAFTVGAFYVLQGQWRNLSSGYLLNSGQDQTMWEWFFTVVARSVAEFQNPLFSDLQNYPLGVNLMANTAMLGVSVPLAPITLLFGATATWAIALTAGLAASAFAWYWLLSRQLDTSKGAAAVGGALAGFAPGIISHANGHPNFVVLFLLPVIAMLVIRISRGGGTVRNTVGLGLIVAVQILLGEEPLLIFAITFGIFTLVYFLFRPGMLWPSVKNAVPRLAAAAALTLALVAFPLWWQFFGPSSYAALEHGPVGNDLKALVQFPTQSIGGHLIPGQDVRLNATEENAYFGWPLLLLSLVAAVWLWRIASARAAAVTTLVMIVLSLGSFLAIGGRDTGIPLPWDALSDVPLVESILETRFALGAVPLLAILLALATDRVLRTARPRARAIWFAGVAIALVPLFPTPLVAVDAAPAPQFFAEGTWQEYVDDGSVVTVPLPRPGDARPLRWQMDSDMAFRLAGGYFVGPNGQEDRIAKYGPIDRPTAQLLISVYDSGTIPEVTSDQRAQAREDLEFWQADVVVLPPGDNGAALRTTVNELLGVDAEFRDDVWVWDVRQLVQ